MKIAFNPSTVAALITPPNNKDITFDLRGRNIFARGVKFCGTDTWRDIKINNVSIGSNILDLRNGSNTTLTNTNGVVTINSTWRPVVDNLTSDSTTSSLSANQGRVLKSLIDGKSNSGHTHDDRYLKLTGGTMTGNIILSPNTKIIKPLASTSNYDSIVRWSVDGETKKYGREIGLHNTGGDSTGSIAIIPYKTDTEPWSGNVGLFIAKNTLKLDGKPIALKNDIPTSLKNPYSLTLQANGTTLATYDGSVSKIVNLTYDNVGAAAKNHTHNSLEPWASYITGDSHATALKSIFDKNKTSIPRNKFISMFSSTYGNGSYYMGYFLNGYENAPYGGFFVAHYDTAYYIGISNGSFAQHRLVYSTDIPNSLKNPHALTISLNGTSQGPYDGSAAKSINITPSSIGAATSEHNHDNRYLKLTGGTMQLGEGLKFHADDNYFGTNSDARIISLLDSNGAICDGGLIIDERATLDGKEYVTELLRIRDSEFKWRGNNILHGGNYSGILDSRYYTESEVNNLLSKKLNTSDFNWTNLKDKPNTVQGYGISNALIVSYDGNNYVNASMPSSQLSKLAGQYYIECWDNAGGWWNWMAGKFMKAGSSDAYVLLGGGGHKLISDFATAGHTHDGRYLRWNGSIADISAMNWGTLTAANGYTILSHAASSDGGAMGVVNKGGQIFMQLDGYYYQREGKYRVLDTSDFTTFSNIGSQTTRITIGGVTKDLKIDADLLDGQHGSRYTGALGGLNYITINVGGDANTYYPVVISNISAIYPMQFVNISRVYNETAPNTWNTSTHKGGLTLTLLWNGSRFWDGNSSGNACYCVYKYESYSTMVGGLGNATGGKVVWLRGGGAVYHIHSMNGTSTSVTVYTSTYTDVANHSFSPKTTPEVISVRWPGMAQGADYATSASNADTATKVIVNQHTTNDTNYPLVWSNQNNSNNVTENQLYKSWSDLYYNPKNKRLTVGGSIYAAHFYESSDKTLKKNIKSILSSTNIPKIREFDWKDTEEHSYGFIAQELEEQGYDCLVSEVNGKKTVNYTATLALTVAKLQNLINIQNKKISNLTKELKALKYGRKKNS